jgi:hypothetical protein
MVMEWIHYLSTYYQMHVGSCGYIPSCQVPKVATFRGPGLAMLIHCGRLQGAFHRGPESLPLVNERGEMGRQVVKSYLFTLIIGWRSGDMH